MHLKCSFGRWAEYNNMRKIGRVDSNQKQLVKELRAIGASVAITSNIGNGFVDIVVGYKGVNYLFEIKDGEKVPSQRKLTPDEVEFFAKWSGNCHVVHNLNECLLAFNKN
jgi:Holliday junction resolvase